MSLKTQVIVNHESDKGKTRKRWKYIKEGLNSFLKEFKYEFTEKRKKDFLFKPALLITYRLNLYCVGA